MPEIKVYFEPETELMTILWHHPRNNQICTELDDGVILSKDSVSNEPIVIELLSCKPDDNRISGISVRFDRASA